VSNRTAFLCETAVSLDIAVARKVKVLNLRFTLFARGELLRTRGKSDSTLQLYLVLIDRA